MHAFDRQTDGRTDRQTDRIPIVIPRLHSMQRGKNETQCSAVYDMSDHVTANDLIMSAAAMVETFQPPTPTNTAYEPTSVMLRV